MFKGVCALFVMTGFLLLGPMRGYAQSDAASAPANASGVPDSTSAGQGQAAAGATSSSTKPTPEEQRLQMMKELDAMKQRIAELESQIRASEAESDASKLATGVKEVLQPVAGSEGQSMAMKMAPAKREFDAEVTTKSAPFAYADWTWLNGTARTKDTPLATKYFVPEFRADINYMFDFNHPKDDSMGGSTESFRSDEVQVEQLSFGGDIRVQNVRGRFLTMYGLFATTTPRNDPSTIRGQWDLANAYRYVSEAWGGYHWDVQHGLNLDAGIFVSYIGLFSYYNFDNWAYQPSYVSSNTPWFFNGVRAQWFPTEKLKIEPWFINGWQSYARSNGKPGLGGQIMYRPQPWLAMVFNNYGLGEDAPGIPGRSRLHTDDSVEVKYYDQPSRFLDKAAFSLTGDLGCEFGGGVSCTGKGGNPKQAFLGWMGYSRLWFKKDLYGLTLGGGQMNNPGRYLTLLPPINGATAATGTPYFTENPGNKMHAYDSTATFDYMPSQFITFRAEMGYRHTDVPYWTGKGGITPPGGNNGSPANYACMTGSSSGTNSLAAAEAACGGGITSVWFPDLRRQQIVATGAILVKF